MNIVNKNILANYFGKIWGFISIFIFVRFYLELLGVESYAIINFYTVIIGLLAFADAGLTATLTRELSRDISINDKANLVYTFERIYCFICLLIFLIIVFSANFIANNFLGSSTYSSEKISLYLQVMGLGIAIQLFATLYEGGLNGLQQQVLTNKIRIIWSLFRSGIVLIPLYFYPKLEFYFGWQVISNFALLYIFRKKLYSFFPSGNLLFSVEQLKLTSHYALGMMGIAFISAINMQIDKLVTSKYLSLEQFGYYSIASTLSQLPTMIVMPIIVAIFPVFSMLVSQNKSGALEENFHKFSFIITLISAPITFCIFIYSVPLIDLWTGKLVIAETVNFVMKMLIIGSFFLCLQFTPFYLALANGYTKINLYTGVVGLFVVVPLIIYSINKYGMIGATLPWVLLNFSTLFIVGIYIVNKFLPKQTYNWLKWDILVPTAVVVLVGCGVESLFGKFVNQYVFIFKSFLIGILSIFLNILIYNKRNFKSQLIDFLKIINFRKKL